VDTAGPSSTRAWSLGPVLQPNRRVLLILTVLAVVTRLLWVLLVHPPGDYIFSDMRKYLERATEVAELGMAVGHREFAWQAWGTHVLLSIPLRLFGVDRLDAAAALWGLMAAAAVPLSYLLAARVCTRPKVPEFIGIVVLLWHPNVSNAGYFLSETPFLCFALASTLALVRTLQTGKGALLAGCLSAIAFAVRPQSALFFLLVAVTWLVNRRRLPHVRPIALVLVALPLLGMLAFSAWRFHAHTGYWAGVAENANMNLTAGRCHNIVTQAYRTEAEMRRAVDRENTNDGRRVSLPNFRLAWKLPTWHPMALRPVLGEESVRFVGYIGDPEIHREIRKQCYAKSGIWHQIRMSFVNVMLTWFVDRQWPEMEKGREIFLPIVDVYSVVFQIVIWAPSMLGMGLGVWWIRRRPALTLVAWQIVNSMVVAAIFFGTIRLRTPYDPYAFILAVEGVLWASPRVRAWWARRRAARPAAG
jgi:hypothetical protein